MKERIDLPSMRDPTGWLESQLSELGLGYKKLTLAKYKGCQHWHITNPGQTGTLEATWWPHAGEFWLERRSGRTAPWQEEIIDELLRRRE